MHVDEHVVVAQRKQTPRVFPQRRRVPWASCSRLTLPHSSLLSLFPPPPKLIPQAETDLEQKRTEWRARLELRRAEAEDIRWHVDYLGEARGQSTPGSFLHDGT